MYGKGATSIPTRDITLERQESEGRIKLTQRPWTLRIGGHPKNPPPRLLEVLLPRCWSVDSDSPEQRKRDGDPGLRTISSHGFGPEGTVAVVSKVSRTARFSCPTSPDMSSFPDQRRVADRMGTTISGGNRRLLEFVLTSSLTMGFLYVQEATALGVDRGSNCTAAAGTTQKATRMDCRPTRRTAEDFTAGEA